MVKIVLVLFLLCSACLTSSCPKGEEADVKVRRTTLSIQDNMNPLHPFIF